MLAALACGVPVAAYPVAGPLDVIGREEAAGCLDEDLGRAVQGALTRDRARCRDYAERFSWRACAERFAANLEPF